MRSMNLPLPTIAILGASGLIGHAVALQLMGEGFRIVPIARQFNAAQKAAFGNAVECPIVELDAKTLLQVLDEQDADIVVNCIGVLQDSGGARTDAVHRGFATRLVEVLSSRAAPSLLVQLSIPGRDDQDRTPFSLTKREAERVISSGAVPFIILRAGFVVAPAAYGGSALIRSLAVLPFDLPRREATSPFAVTDVRDIARSIAVAGRRWRDGNRNWNAVWEVMERHPSTVGQVVAAFRRHLGGPEKRVRLPSWLMTLGAKAGDLAAHLGWSPPIRSTALSEMRRGVTGDPEPWIVEVGGKPSSLDEVLRDIPATIQEKWFARLFLAKPFIIGSLVVFWVISGLIALTVAFDAATAILTSHGFPPNSARAITVVSSAADIAVGIAFRRTCHVGLLAGIGVSLFYMASAALITPDIWIEPLGALVKTVPAIVLMLVALAILEDR